jgi:hypothetical protein
VQVRWQCRRRRRDPAAVYRMEKEIISINSCMAAAGR